MYEIIYKLYGEQKSVKFSATSDTKAENKSRWVAAALGIQMYELRKV